MADNDNTDEREKHRAELRQREWVVVLNDDETYSGLRGSWIAFSPPDTDDDHDEAVKEISQDSRLDLWEIIKFAIKHGYMDQPSAAHNGPSWYVSIPYEDGRAEKYSVLIDDSQEDKDIHTEADAIDYLDNDLEQDTEWETPDGLNFDTKTWTCRRLTAEEAETVHADANFG
jgi:hypothetical protein